MKVGVWATRPVSSIRHQVSRFPLHTNTQYAIHDSPPKLNKSFGFWLLILGLVLAGCHFNQTPNEMG
jgi:hypothetical protein